MFSPFDKSPISSVRRQKLTINSPLLSPSVRKQRPSSIRNVSLSQSLMNSTLDETLDPNVEHYGCPLPVLVIEALTTADRISDITVKLEPFGYASLVCGRQLLIWKYKQDELKATHCKELTLPPSDLAHKAELVHLFQTEDSNLPSALAVSPEGHVRFWPNINHEGSSVDAQPDLQGQECCFLSSIYPLGCVLATTSSSLIIITPTIDEGQPNIIYRTVTSSGVLAGLGRRVSSFIFGVIPSQTSETKQLNRVLSIRNDDDDYFLYVLCNSNIQKWHITRRDRKDNTNQLLFDVDMDADLKQKYCEEVFKIDPKSSSDLKAWCLDMQLCQSGVMVLTAGTLAGRPGSSVKYAIGIINTVADENPRSFSTFHPSAYSELYQEEYEDRISSYKFLLPSADSASAYIYNSHKVICVPVIPTQEEELNEIDFSTSGSILGSGSCRGIPLFFTRHFGVVSISQTQKWIEDSRFLSSVKDVSIRISEESPDSLCAALRSAVCSYFSNDMEKCEKLMGEVLSRCASGEERERLDDAVVSLSLCFIDDFPVSDPRWLDSVPAGSVCSSLFITYQLDDKLKAHDCMLMFLNHFRILEKLTTVKVNDYKVPTKVVLCEHAEKLVAAKTLRLCLRDHAEVIETTIRDTLDRRGIEVKNHLTPQDVFFREVSTFHSIFPSLIDWELEKLNADQSMEEIVRAIMTVNKIFVSLLESVSEYRSNRKNSYNVQDQQPDFFPWTSRDGQSGIRSHIRNQLDVNAKKALDLSDNIEVQFLIFQQYVELVDFYLGTFRPQLAAGGERGRSARAEFERERGLFIRPLLFVQQYERAASIAEKYHDFDVLVQMCEETQDFDRLQRYMLQFTEQRFTEFVFKWFLEKGKRGKIFDQHLGQREALGHFLQEHEGLRWIYFMQEEKFDLAHATLRQLALKEAQFLARKKTLLSLSKLCALVSDMPQEIRNNQVEALNQELDLITHQETLPLAVVEAFGIDPQNMRVFSPEELIEMYIAEENSTANSFDFKIALDLLNFIKKPSDDPDVYNLRMRIWAKAILRDNWEELDNNSPLEAIRETIFFQIIQMAFDQGQVDMLDFIPSLDLLLQSPDLGELPDNPSVKFLLQAGYEQVHKIIA